MTMFVLLMYRTAACRQLSSRRPRKNRPDATSPSLQRTRRASSRCQPTRTWARTTTNTSSWLAVALLEASPLSTWRSCRSGANSCATWPAASISTWTWGRPSIDMGSRIRGAGTATSSRWRSPPSRTVTVPCASPIRGGSCVDTRMAARRMRTTRCTTRATSLRATASPPSPETVASSPAPSARSRLPRRAC